MNPMSRSSASRRGALLCLVLLFALPAAAAPRALRYDLRLDLPITGVELAGWIGSQALEPQLAPQQCRWCEPGLAIDVDVRRALKWSDIDAGDAASNVSGFVLAPVSALGLTALAAAHDDGVHGYPLDLLIIAEATASAQVVNQAVKFFVGRERPFVHALAEGEKGLTAHPADNNVSFFSGHTTFSFALAVSAGTVASMRGYRWAPWVWGTGLTVALATAYFRIAGDRHYLSDVVCGAVVGSLFGFAVPYLFHRPEDSSPLQRQGAGLSSADLPPPPVPIGAVFTFDLPL